MKKCAFITGITGQDGAYLARLLLDKEYVVHGLVRRSSVDNLTRLRAICADRFAELTLHEGDLTDSMSIARAIKCAEPDELYNLAAQSDVGISFHTPAYTTQVNALGVVHILEAVRLLGLEKKTRIYHASTSELFGKVAEIPQRETTPFCPQSPYAISKLCAYWFITHYRTTYGMHAVNGILFNHESAHRGNHFVTKKIILGLMRWKKNHATPLLLGNLDARRDWGYAPEYVEAMWRLVQLPTPQDIVVATGTMYTVKEFVEMSAEALGIQLLWQGDGAERCAYDCYTGRLVVTTDKQLYRPAEVDLLWGDPTRAYELLGWRPQVTGKELVRRMVAELQELA